MLWLNAILIKLKWTVLNWSPSWQIIAFGDIHLVPDFRLLLFEKDFHTSIKSSIFKIRPVCPITFKPMKMGGLSRICLIPEYSNSRIKAKKVLHRDKNIKMDIVQTLKRLNSNWTVWFMQETKKSRKQWSYSSVKVRSTATKADNIFSLILVFLFQIS